MTYFPDSSRIANGLKCSDANILLPRTLRLLGPILILDLPTQFRQKTTRQSYHLGDEIDHRPSGLDRVLADEERAVAGHRVAQELQKR